MNYFSGLLSMLKVLNLNPLPLSVLKLIFLLDYNFLFFSPDCVFCGLYCYSCGIRQGNRREIDFRTLPSYISIWYIVLHDFIMWVFGAECKVTYAKSNRKICQRKQSNARAITSNKHKRPNKQYWGWKGGVGWPR